MRGLLHKLAHLFGWNTGEVEVFWRWPHLWVGFRCHGCGELRHVHESAITRKKRATLE